MPRSRLAHLARLALVLLLAVRPFAARAQRPRVPLPPGAMPAPGPPAATAPEPGSELTIYLLTMGVGEQIWEKFGHNAIWIHDARLGTDVAYNWGLFSFAQQGFIPRFLEGRMLYSMGGFTMDQTLEEYRYLDRTVWAQELDLTPAQRAALRDFIAWNALPQNRDYRYDYYRDNCSTRVRDAIDRVLGGQFRRATADRPSGHSYRWETMRLVQDQPVLATGMDIGLGRPGDHEMTQWEAMFLPMRLRTYANALRITDVDGRTHPLVKRELVLYQSTSRVEPERPPRWWPAYLLIGLALAGLFTWLGVRAVGGSRRARMWASLLYSLFAFVAGVLGVLLTLLWAVTDHVFAHRNENLLLFHPLWLVLAVLAPLTAIRGTLARVTRWLAATAAVLGVLAVAIHVVGLSRQVNWPVIALALPPILALAWAVQRGTG